MDSLLNKLKNKKVHVIFFGTFFSGGGVAAANFIVEDIAEGFIQLLDEQGRTEFCKLDQIKQIIVQKDDAQEGKLV